MELRVDLGLLSLAAQYWSVDHFYNEKEDSEDSFREKPTSSVVEVGLLTRYLRLEFKGESDSPTE